MAEPKINDLFGNPLSVVNLGLAGMAQSVRDQQVPVVEQWVPLLLFAGNAIRRIRAAVGEPTAVISAHRAPDAPGGGELRLSLSSPFDPRDAEGFRCPLHPLDLKDRWLNDHRSKAAGLDRAATLALVESWKTQATIWFNLGGLIGTLATIPVAKHLGRKPMFAIYFAAARFEEGKFERSALAGDYARYRRRAGMFLPRFALLFGALQK